MIKVVAIVGPTAVGKTQLSIELAQQFHGEIISGDSMQVYRHLDIGTAKITTEEMAGIPHHLIDILDVDQRFSVADFQRLAGKAIREIDARGKLPIIVGGTGFYLQSLTRNLNLGGDQFGEQTKQIRDKWQAYLAEHGPELLWRELANRDLTAAKVIEQANSRRVIRALEVIDQTGHLFSDQPTQEPEFEFQLIGLNTEREVLYQRINRRVEHMVINGLLEEAHWLFQKGGREFQAGKGIGYRELFDFFEGHSELEPAVNKIKQDSRHYAKRQLTWFRNQMVVDWFDLVSKSTDELKIISSVQQFLQSVSK